MGRKGKNVTENHCNCIRCHYTWVPLGGARPKVCPRCKSYSWDQPYKRQPRAARAE